MDELLHTNRIETVSAVCGPGLKGIYHHVGVKHVGQYVDEYAFRPKAGACGNHTMNRTATCENLTAD